MMDWTFVSLAVEHYIALRQYERAQDLVEQILRRDPKNAEARERIKFLKSLERRRARRIQQELIVFASRVGTGSPRGFAARILDVSRIGVQLIGPEETRKDEKFIVEIPARVELEDPLKLPCKSVWCRPDGEFFRSGLELGKLNREQEMTLLEWAVESLFRPPEKA